MKRFPPRFQLFASLIFAGVGLVFFFGNDYRPWFRVPFDIIGVALFIAAVWFFVDAVQRVPADDAISEIAPAEWQTWVGLAFCSALLVSMWQQIPILSSKLPIYLNHDASRAGRGIGSLLVAWAVLGYVLRQRWPIGSDERDHRIEQIASGWGRAATTLAVISLAVLLSFSPLDRLQAISYPLIGHLLIAALVLGAWVDHLTASILYRRDRLACALL